MALSDKTQMSLMKRDKPSMKQKGPPDRSCDYPKRHEAKSLSDGKQYSQMRRK
jgi:hypothetical protein